MIYISGMLNRGRSSPSNRGGRGRGNPSHRGGRGLDYGNTIGQHGNKKLIAANLSGAMSEFSHTELADAMKWKQLQGTDVPSSSSQPSFSSAVQNTTNKEDNMCSNDEERVILILQETDKKWENKPWVIYDRYLGGHGYTMETYKPRHFYEIILSVNGCTFNHFTYTTNKEIYNFSKIVINYVISMPDWGISPLTEKNVLIKGTTVKYNYWDYIQALDKVFFYENNKRSHTWFIKIMPEVYNDLPIWMIKWWQFYGTTERILPSFIKEDFHKWKMMLPSDQLNKLIPIEMRFSIPWIWRTCPVTGYDEGFFCLKRKSYTRFWDTMLNKDDKGELACTSTIKAIKDSINSYMSLKEAADKECREKEQEKFLEFWEDDTTSIDIHEASQRQIVKAYMENLRKILKIKKAEEKTSKSDTSMASNYSQNSLDALLPEAQVPEDDSEIDIDQILAFIEGGKGKEKAEN